MKEREPEPTIETNEAGFIEIDVNGEFTKQEALDLADDIIEEVR